MRRLAVSEAHFRRDLKIDATDACTAAVVDALSKLGFVGINRMVVDTKLVQVTGQAWRFKGPSAAAEPAPQLIAVRSNPLAASPASNWGSDVTIKLLNSKREHTSTIVIDGDEFGMLEEGGGGTILENVEPSDELRAAFNRLFDECRPTVAACLEMLPAQPSSAFVSPRNSRLAYLPEWLVGLFVKWASLHLRLHVLFNSTMPLDGDGVGRSSEFFVDGATVEHVTFNGRVSRRVILYLHPFACGCICGNHHDDVDASTHKFALVQLDFCGIKSSSCPYHPTPAASSTHDERVCAHDAVLKVSCAHTDVETQRPTYTKILRIELDDDPFLAAFATACVELTERPAAVSREVLQTELERQFEFVVHTDAQTNVNWEVRDQIVESMLRTKDFFVGRPAGSTRRVTLKNRKLRRRSEGGLSKWMREAGSTTHSHLFPMN